METAVSSVNRNPVMERTELELELDHAEEATPSQEDVVSRITAEHNLDEENVDVEGIYTGFGRQKSTARVKVYAELDIEEAEEDVSEEEDSEEAGEDAEDEVDYSEIVSGTIDEAKEQLQKLDNPDYQKALEAEKNNKNRTTFTDWLESQ